jgi:hypothetical protein
MFIPNSNFFPSRIPDQTTATKAERKAKFCVSVLLLSLRYGFGIRDPGSGKNLLGIQDPGVKKAPEATLLTSGPYFLINLVVALLIGGTVTEYQSDGKCCSVVF